MDPVGDPAGRCEADPAVHAEATPDLSTGPADLAFTPIPGFTAPAGLGQAEIREVFTSAGAFERYFGAPAPGVDFAQRWVLFYSVGTRATDGFAPAVTRIRVVDDQLRVDTTLESPGPGCPVKGEATTPALLVAFDRPALSTCFATFHHAGTTRACVPVDPGPACDGLLTDRGIDELVTGRPRATIPNESTESPYRPNAVSLGRYATGRWTRTCKSDTECDPWEPVTLMGDYYKGDASFYRSGTSQMLILVSDLYTYLLDIGGNMHKNCYRYADGDGDLMKVVSGATEAKVSLTERSGCVQGGATANGDSFRLGPLTGRMADRCFRLTDRKREQLGVAAFRDTLTALTGSW